MTDRLTPTAVTEQLDRAGLLSDARGPGCYALRVATPDRRDAVARAFTRERDVTPKDRVLGALTADNVAYVGASMDVYDRLTDHAEGAVRQATLLEVFDPTRVVDVWPHEQPFTEEYNHAAELSRQGWRVWYDGQVL